MPDVPYATLAYSPVVQGHVNEESMWKFDRLGPDYVQQENRQKLGEYDGAFLSVSLISNKQFPHIYLFIHYFSPYWCHVNINKRYRLNFREKLTKKKCID